jgi:hypothetical protein
MPSGKISVRVLGTRCHVKWVVSAVLDDCGFNPCGLTATMSGVQSMWMARGTSSADLG